MSKVSDQTTPADLAGYEVPIDKPLGTPASIPLDRLLPGAVAFAAPLEDVAAAVYTTAAAFLSVGTPEFNHGSFVVDDTGTTDVVVIPANQNGVYDVRIKASVVSLSSTTTRDSLELAVTRSRAGTLTTYPVVGTKYVRNFDTDNHAVTVSVSLKLLLEGGDEIGATLGTTSDHTLTIVGAESRISLVKQGGAAGAPGISGGVTIVTDATLTGDGSPADPAGVASPFAADEKAKLASLAVNPAAAGTAVAIKLQLDGTVYTLPDDVEDVTDTGSRRSRPPTTSRSSSTTTPRASGSGTARSWPLAWIRRARSRIWPPGARIPGRPCDRPVEPEPGAGLLQHEPAHVAGGDRERIRRRRVSDVGFQQAVRVQLGINNAHWLGEQASDLAALLVLTGGPITGHRYFFYSTTTNTVRDLDVSTYVAGTNEITHYVAEPISVPTGVGSIAGVTAGAGLTGGGTSGVVTVAMDATEADFPVVPVAKGGTGAITAAAGLTALGGTSLADALAAMAGSPARTSRSTAIRPARSPSMQLAEPVAASQP